MLMFILFIDLGPQESGVPPCMFTGLRLWATLGLYILMTSKPAN